MSMLLMLFLPSFSLSLSLSLSLSFISPSTDSFIRPITHSVLRRDRVQRAETGSRPLQKHFATARIRTRTLTHSILLSSPLHHAHLADGVGVRRGQLLSREAKFRVANRQGVLEPVNFRCLAAGRQTHVVSDGEAYALLCPLRCCDRGETLVRQLDSDDALVCEAHK